MANIAHLAHSHVVQGCAQRIDEYQPRMALSGVHSGNLVKRVDEAAGLDREPCFGNSTETDELADHLLFDAGRPCAIGFKHVGMLSSHTRSGRPSCPR